MNPEVREEFRKFDYDSDVIANTFLPFSDLRRSVLEEGIYKDICQSSNIYRLARIKQLSNLVYIGPSPERQYFIPTDHDRFGHTISVATVAEYIGKNNLLSADNLNLLIASSLLHDIATPAHGDATMKIDPENLDEEENLRASVPSETIQALSRYGISINDVEKTVKNEGQIGKILDIADRIAYVMNDLHGAGFRGNKDQRNKYNREISKILWRFPKIGNIIDDVKIDYDTQEIYFENPDRLEAFLRLRALLSSKLYYHPISQGRDLIYEMMLKRIYSPVPGESKLDPYNLRTMGDEQLDRILFSEYGSLFKLDYKDEGTEFTFQQALYNFYSQTEKFPSRGEAEIFADSLDFSDEFSVMGIVENKGFKTATDYLVKDRNGKIVPFYEYRPGASSQIQTMSDSLKGYYVHYLIRAQKPRECEFVDFLKSES